MGWEAVQSAIALIKRLLSNSRVRWSPQRSLAQHQTQCLNNTYLNLKPQAGFDLSLCFDWVALLNWLGKAQYQQLSPKSLRLGLGQRQHRQIG